MKKLLVMLVIFVFASILIFGQADSSMLKFSFASISKSGIYNTTEMNFGVGLGDTNADYSKSFFGVTGGVGLGIFRNLLCGIGTGVFFYNGGTLIPIYLDIRYFLEFGKISAYAFSAGGLLLNISGSNDGTRLLLNPGLGIKYHLGNKISANIGAGVLIQTIKDKERDSFFNFKLGIIYSFSNQQSAFQ